MLIDNTMMRPYESLINECRLPISAVYGIILQSVYIKISRYAREWRMTDATDGNQI